MRRKLSALLFLLIPLSLLTACGPTEGIVVDKSYVEAHYDMLWTTCPGDTKGRLCPTQQYYPDSWSLKIDPETEGEKTGWRSVSSGMYEACAIGSRFLHTDDSGDSCSN